MIGEVNGYPIQGFDLPNSPSTIKHLDLTDKRLVMRTTAGTQGVVLAHNAENILVSSLCVATSSANLIKALQPDAVTFIDTGVRTKGGGEEDSACSDYIASILQGTPLPKEDILQRVTHSKTALKFSNPDDDDFNNEDLEDTLKFDLFSFAMKVTQEENQFILRSVLPSEIAHHNRNEIP